MTQNKNKKNIEARPFVKWAGGKGNILNILESQLPADFDSQSKVTYIEPFVGGGAMLFHMLTTHPNIRRVVINDINKDLIRCYQLVKENPLTLIELLRPFEHKYYELNEEERRLYFYKVRDEYNKVKLTFDQRAAYFFFLNHTCFNGLYRENANGGFNVPFGRYKKPKICNVDVIMADHEVLSKVDIICGDYKNILSHLGKDYNFVYLDPPYRPLLGSDNFKQYSKSRFGDPEQVELKKFCDKLIAKGCNLMLSNSDSTNEDGISYFETLYEGYTFDRVFAPRFINAYAEKREKQAEVLIKNYDNPKEIMPIISKNMKKRFPQATDLSKVIDVITYIYNHPGCSYAEIADHIGFAECQAKYYTDACVYLDLVVDGRKPSAVCEDIFNNTPQNVTERIYKKISQTS